MRQLTRPSLLLWIVPLLILLFSSLPHTPDRWQGKVAQLLSPLWRGTTALRSNLFSSAKEEESQKEKDWLRAENHLLKQENERWRDLLHRESSLLEALARLTKEDKNELSTACKRHRELLKQILLDQLRGMQARVIYRPASTWNSSLWIDVGTSHNREGEEPVITKNSPVLCEGALLGIVDYVGDKESRVRLVGDPSLSIAVRADRSLLRDHFLAEQAVLLRQLEGRKELFETEEENSLWSPLLTSMAEKLWQTRECYPLAKGELRGSDAPFSHAPLLQGIGFNYDFPDEEGRARNLRSGIPEGEIDPDQAIPILQVRDLLVTSGYDGFFPKGLPVAEVVEIDTLSEGDFDYTLKAKPLAPLADCSLVTLIAPMSSGEER